MYLDLKTIKQHLNISLDYLDDDLVLLNISEAVEQFVESYLDVNLQDLEDCCGNIPGPITSAMLLQIGNLYNNREATTDLNMHELPLGFSFLLSPYKNYSVC